MNDNKDKIDDADKTLITEKIAAVKEVLGKSDASKEDFETPTKELNDTMMQVGQKLYSQPGTEWAPTGWEESKVDEDGVQDAEVENDDDKGNTRV